MLIEFGLGLLAVSHVASAQAPPPNPVDISSTIRCESDGCAFSPQLNRALQGLLVWDEAGRTYYTRPVEIGGATYSPVLTSERQEQPDGYLTVSSVWLDHGPVTWNGLTIVGLEASTGHEFDSQAVIFREPAAAVRAVLARFGLLVPEPPAYREFETEGCSASIGLEAHSRGTALVHTGWC